MKIDIPVTTPKNLKETWPGQYSIERWLDNIIYMPMQIFLITTKKENKLNNAQLNARGMTVGSGLKPMFLMNINTFTHTYKNIIRTKEFAINFFPSGLKEQAFATIKNNAEDIDELIASGLLPEKAKIIDCSLINECIAHYECILQWENNIGFNNSIICGKIVSASCDERLLSGPIEERLKYSDILYYLQESIDYTNDCATSQKAYYKTFLGDLFSE